MKIQAGRPANWLKCVIAIAGSQLAGFIGAVFTMPAIATWYAALNRPFLSPPNWVFGPVWTILYTLMGVAAFLVWRQGLQLARVKQALRFFVLQLCLNSLWSMLFFGFQSPGIAFLEILILWSMILVTIMLFFRCSRVAGWLMIPYIVWVSFATYLNGSIWLLNR